MGRDQWCVEWICQGKKSGKICPWKNDNGRGWRKGKATIMDQSKQLKASWFEKSKTIINVSLGHGRRKRRWRKKKKVRLRQRGGANGQTWIEKESLEDQKEYIFKFKDFALK